MSKEDIVKSLSDKLNSNPNMDDSKKEAIAKKIEQIKKGEVKKA